MAKDTQLSRWVLNQGSLAPEEMSVTHKSNCTNHKNQTVFNCSSCAHWEPAVPGPFCALCMNTFTNEAMRLSTHQGLEACADARPHCTLHSQPCCSHGHAAHTQSLCQGSQEGHWCPSPPPDAASVQGLAGQGHPYAGIQRCNARQVVSGGAAASTGRFGRRRRCAGCQ